MTARRPIKFCSRCWRKLGNRNLSGICDRCNPLKRKALGIRNCLDCGAPISGLGITGLCPQCLAQRQKLGQYHANDEGPPGDIELPLPEPTQAWPGTLEKVLIMARRRELGQELFHPLDRGMRS